MVSFDEARRRAASADPLPARRMPLAEAEDCVLAGPVHARLAIPHAATSAMDGWAVAEPLGPAAGPTPRWRLRPGGARGPGDLLDPLVPGEAVGVVTGSPVPRGAVSVLRSEHGRPGVFEPEGPAGEGSAEEAGSGGTFLEPLPETGDLEPGRHIRPAGAEAAAGDQLVPAGAPLTPARAAAAAVGGHDEVLAVPSPRAVLLLTGDEVVASGLPGPGQVRDVFGVALPGMLRDAGARTGPGPHQRIADDPEALVAALEGAEAELIVTSGGTARSAADPLRPALDRLGAEIMIGSVDMRPGHPAVLARLPGRGTAGDEDSGEAGESGEPGARYVLGLPGNPLAGFAAFTALGVPLLRRLRGAAVPEALRSLEAQAAEELPGARRGTRLLPVVAVSAEAGVPVVRPAGHSGAHMMRGLAQASALAVVPQGGLQAGGPVRCLPVPGQLPGLALGGHRGEGGRSWEG